MPPSPHAEHPSVRVASLRLALSQVSIARLISSNLDAGALSPSPPRSPLSPTSSLGSPPLRSPSSQTPGVLPSPTSTRSSSSSGDSDKWSYFSRDDAQFDPTCRACVGKVVTKGEDAGAYDDFALPRADPGVIVYKTPLRPVAIRSSTSVERRRLDNSRSGRSSSGDGLPRMGKSSGLHARMSRCVETSEEGTREEVEVLMVSRPSTANSLVHAMGDIVQSTRPGLALQLRDWRAASVSTEPSLLDDCSCEGCEGGYDIQTADLRLPGRLETLEEGEEEEQDCNLLISTLMVRCRTGDSRTRARVRSECARLLKALEMQGQVEKPLTDVSIEEVKSDEE